MSTFQTGHNGNRPPLPAIKEWRTFRRLTQQALADKAGTSKSLISRYETGSFDMSTAVLFRIADVLEITIAELYIDPPSGPDELREELRLQRERAKYAEKRKAFLERRAIHNSR